MRTAQEARKFFQELVDAGNLSEKTRKVLLEDTPKEIEKSEGSLSYLDKSVATQSQWSKRMDDLKEKEKKAEAAIRTSQQLTGLVEDMRKQASLPSPQFRQFQEEAAKAKADAASTVEALKKAQWEVSRVYEELRKREGGLTFLQDVGWDDFNRVNSYFPPPSVQQHQISSSNPPNLLDGNGNIPSMEEIIKRVKEEMGPSLYQLAEWPLDITAMLQDYNSLTGKVLPAKEFKDKLNEALKTSKFSDPWQAYESLYDIPNLRKEQERKAWEIEFRKRWEEEQRQKMQEGAFPSSGGSPEQENPLFDAIQEERKKNESSSTPFTGSSISDLVAQGMKEKAAGEYEGFTLPF